MLASNRQHTSENKARKAFRPLKESLFHEVTFKPRSEWREGSSTGPCGQAPPGRREMANAPAQLKLGQEKESGVKIKLKW